MLFSVKILIFSIAVGLTSSSPARHKRDGPASCTTYGDNYKCVLAEECGLVTCKDYGPATGQFIPLCEAFKNDVEIFTTANCLVPRQEQAQGCCPVTLILNTTTTTTSTTTTASPPSNCRTLDDGYTCVPASQCRVMECSNVVQERSGLTPDCPKDDIDEAYQALNYTCIGPKISIANDDICCKNEFIQKVQIDSTSSPIPVPTERLCGARYKDGFGLRVGSGLDSATSFGEWPNMCILMKDGYFLAGASLITPTILLTSATKLFQLKNLSYESLTVRCGEWNLSVRGDVSVEKEDHQELQVKNIIMHPNYEDDILVHNIAVVQVADPFAVNGSVFPVCLPSSANAIAEIKTDSCVATGWGRSPTEEPGTRSDVLRQKVLPIVGKEECEQKLSAALKSPPALHESMLCAGGKSNEDTCEGDGGGPLMCQEAQSGEPDGHVFIQIGITSFGAGCGLADTPGVYTSVGSELCFINYVTKCLESGKYNRYYNFDSECQTWLKDQREIAKRRTKEAEEELEATATGIKLIAARYKVASAKRSQKQVDDLEFVVCPK